MVSSLLEDRAENRRIDQTQEEKRLEHCVRDLWLGAEELGGLSGIGRDETFHLGKDVKELWGRERAQSLRYSIWARQARW